MGEWESGSFTQCGVQIVQHRHQNRWAGFSLSCAHYAESIVLLDLSSARRKQREDHVTAKELAGLRGLLGQLMWLATQVVPQLQAPLSLLLGYLGVATVSTLLEANKLARRALVWAQTPLRTFVHEEMSVIGWSDATWELVGETIPLQRWQEAAAQIPSALVLDSRGVRCTCTK